MSVNSPATATTKDNILLEGNLINLNLTIGGVWIGQVNGISGLEWEREIEEYSEGGTNHFTYKFPGRISYSDVTIERDYQYQQRDATGGKRLVDWFMGGGGGSGTGGAERKDIEIYLYGTVGGKFRDRIATITILGAIPQSYSLDSINLDENKTTVTESLVVAHQGFMFTHEAASDLKKSDVEVIATTKRDGEEDQEETADDGREDLDPMAQASIRNAAVQAARKANTDAANSAEELIKVKLANEEAAAAEGDAGGPATDAIKAAEEKHEKNLAKQTKAMQELKDNGGDDVGTEAIIRK